VRGLRFLAAAGVLALASRVSGESLGEAAAREQARRDASRRKDGPAVVIHEEELKNASGRIANDPTIAPAARLLPPPTYVGGAMLLSDDDVMRRGIPVTPHVAPAPGAQDDIHTREAYWREEARRRREEAAATEQVLKDVERWSDPTYAGKDRPSCRVIRNGDRRKARTDAARAREALKALDEEARVGGALPGWVRE
jgi:hypothetical protein